MKCTSGRNSVNIATKHDNQALGSNMASGHRARPILPSSHSQLPTKFSAAFSSRKFQRLMNSVSRRCKLVAWNPIASKRGSFRKYGDTSSGTFK